VEGSRSGRGLLDVIVVDCTKVKSTLSLANDGACITAFHSIPFSLVTTRREPFLLVVGMLRLHGLLKLPTGLLPMPQVFIQAFCLIFHSPGTSGVILVYWLDSGLYRAREEDGKEDEEA
jgi:hypothetical protein